MDQLSCLKRALVPASRAEGATAGSGARKSRMPDSEIRTSAAEHARDAELVAGFEDAVGQAGLAAAGPGDELRTTTAPISDRPPEDAQAGQNAASPPAA